MHRVLILLHRYTDHGIWRWYNFKAGWCGGGGNCVKINITPLIKQYMLTCLNFQILQYLDLSKARTNYWLCRINWNAGFALTLWSDWNGKKINSKPKLPPGKSLKVVRGFWNVRIKTDVLKSDLIIKIN